MTTRHSLYEVRDAVRTEISEALDESLVGVRVEVMEVNAEEETCSVKGTFKVTPILSTIVKRRGKFEAKLDESLKIISLKITEET